MTGVKAEEAKAAAHTPRRTQQERSASTRSALLHAAACAVVESGPSTSVAEIARLAGVSTGALQHHFASKTELLVAVVEVGWNDLVVRSKLVDDSVPPAERVRALVFAVWDSYRLTEARAAHLISSDPGIHADVSLGIAPVFDGVRQRMDLIWQDVFADLELPVEKIVLARRFARSHLAGMVVQRQMATLEPKPDEELDLLVRATFRILTESEA